MQGVYELAPVIADVISAHCPGTTARERFVRACLGGHWDEAEGMIEGMLSEPWHLRGYQEVRLRQFLDLMPHASVLMFLGTGGCRKGARGRGFMRAR
jgi:hypothetical protein